MPRSTRLFTFALVVGIIWTVHILVSNRHPPQTVSPLLSPLGEYAPTQKHGLDGLAGDGGSAARQRPLTAHPLRTFEDNLAVDFPDVELDQRGLFKFDQNQTQHPIKLLMERAKLQVETQQKRIASVQSVSDAAVEYTNAYGMNPPIGFDKWFEFAEKSKSVPVANMFPLAHQPFLTYLSLPVKTLRKRIEENKKKSEMWTFTFVPDGQGDEGTACQEGETWDEWDWEKRGKGRVKVSGSYAWRWRCNNTLGLILPILPKLPEEFFTQDPPLEMVFNADDGPRGQLHREFQDRSETLGRKGKTWPDLRLESEEQSQRWTYGWQWTCPDDSPLRRWAKVHTLNDEHELESSSTDKAFVGDFYMSTDVCYNPDIRNLHSAALADHRFANVHPAPYISVCRTLRSSDIVGMPLDAVYQDVPPVRWGSKQHNKALWRGSPTGISHTKKMPWRHSQRERLHYFANNQSDGTTPILLDRGAKGLQVEDYPVKLLNEQWFDVGLAGGPAQCETSDGSCQELQNEFDWKDTIRGPEGLTYKYVIDVDGNAWSSRFRRLLLSNNVVLKTTFYPEWFNDILIPWYHYVPIRMDYSDVYDIMAFFVGAPDGSAEGHDDLAKEIAQNGMDFVRQHWRQEDMQSFMFLVMLEYLRLMSPDRSKAVYVP